MLAAEWVAELVVRRLLEQLPEERVVEKVAALALLREQHLQHHGPAESAEPLPPKQPHKRLSGRTLLELGQGAERDQVALPLPHPEVQASGAKLDTLGAFL